MKLLILLLYSVRDVSIFFIISIRVFSSVVLFIHSYLKNLTRFIVAWSFSRFEGFTLILTRPIFFVVTRNAVLSWSNRRNSAISNFQIARNLKIRNSTISNFQISRNSKKQIVARGVGMKSWPPRGRLFHWYFSFFHSSRDTRTRPIPFLFRSTFLHRPSSEVISQDSWRFDEISMGETRSYLPMVSLATLLLFSFFLFVLCIRFYFRPS